MLGAEGTDYRIHTFGGPGDPRPPIDECWPVAVAVIPDPAAAAGSMPQLRSAPSLSAAIHAMTIAEEAFAQIWGNWAAGFDMEVPASIEAERAEMRRWFDAILMHLREAAQHAQSPYTMDEAENTEGGAK